mmetsp:Transcript_10364/g.27586  ORF Transcript_10364/g.27586 Transcript_10364/m.27586 type:complete len:114 (+) Transcript_10364:1570-1911(+)
MRSARSVSLQMKRDVEFSFFCGYHRWIFVFTALRMRFALVLFILFNVLPCIHGKGSGQGFLEPPDFARARCYGIEMLPALAIESKAVANKSSCSSSHSRYQCAHASCPAAMLS